MDSPSNIVSLWTTLRRADCRLRRTLSLCAPPAASSDRDNEDLTYSIEGELPPQWTFNSSSGALTGKPIEAGVYEDLIVFVTNEKTGGYGLLAVFDTIRTWAGILCPNCRHGGRGRSSRCCCRSERSSPWESPYFAVLVSDAAQCSRCLTAPVTGTRPQACLGMTATRRPTVQTDLAASTGRASTLCQTNRSPASVTR